MPFEAMTLGKELPAYRAFVGLYVHVYTPDVLRHMVGPAERPSAVRALKVLVASVHSANMPVYFPEILEGLRTLRTLPPYIPLNLLMCLLRMCLQIQHTVILVPALVALVQHGLIRGAVCGREMGVKLLLLGEGVAAEAALVGAALHRHGLYVPRHGLRLHAEVAAPRTSGGGW